MTKQHNSIQFAKMHGLGNDFILVNEHQTQRIDYPWSKMAQQMCSRHKGIGVDGLILLEKGTHTDFFMRMYNPDGSESEACGNGTRCFAKYLINQNLIDKDAFTIETRAGLLDINLQNGLVSVDMGAISFLNQDTGLTSLARLDFIEQPIQFLDQTMIATAASIGNPHLVLFVENVEKVPLETWGSALENHTYFPKRINVHFVQVVSQNELIQRTRERGAGATLACGSGACCVAAVAYKTKKTTENVNIQLPGGKPQIEITHEFRAIMTGPAVHVFQGTWLIN